MDDEHVHIEPVLVRLFGDDLCNAALIIVANRH